MHPSFIPPKRHLLKSAFGAITLAGLTASVAVPAQADARPRAQAPLQARQHVQAQSAQSVHSTQTVRTAQTVRSAPSLRTVRTARAGTGTYVALGDSMPAGPLVPNPTGPIACARSTHNYPHELAVRLGATTLRDVTCSGASSRHMTQPQELSLLDVPAGTAPPQLDALSTDTALVTLTIGGNDAGLVGVAQDCVRVDPSASPCRDEYVQGGVDRVAERIDAFEPKLSAVLDGIHARAPRARVVLTGYGLYIKPRGCWPIQPVLPTDADYLQGGVGRLNTVIERQVTAHGDTYVDLVVPSAGHDTCQAPSQRWIEGYVPLSPAAPLHPNRAGEANYARIIAGVIGNG